MQKLPSEKYKLPSEMGYIPPSQRLGFDIVFPSDKIQTEPEILSKKTKQQTQHTDDIETLPCQE